MRTNLVWTIFRKEIIDSLRDRRTLVMMLGIPILLYPLVIIASAKFQESQTEAREARSSIVAVWGELPPALESRLRANKRIVLKPGLGFSDSLRNSLASRAFTPPDPKPPRPATVETPLVRAARAVTLDRRADAVILVWPDLAEASKSGGTGTISVLFDSVRPDSGKARDRLTEELQEWRRAELSRREQERGLPKGFTRAAEILSENVAHSERRSGMLLGTILCAMLLVMSALGGFYTAIDQTAGEKERGTMQTLLCAPLRPVEIIAGKFLAVCAVSLAASAANLISMGATMARVTFGFGDLQMTWSAFALALMAMVPTCITLSALYLAVAAFARDFKEGQSLLTPLMTVVLLPVIALMSPSVELSGSTAFVPIMNLALLVKAIFVGEAKADIVFLVMLASAAYAMLAILFAARVFERETIMLGGREQVRRMFDSRGTRGGAPSASWALSMFAIVMVVNFYGQMWLMQWGPLAVLSVVFVAFFLLPPAAAAIAGRYSWRETFSFRLPSVAGAVAAVLLGSTAWIVVSGLLLRLLPPPPSLARAIEDMLLIRDASVPLALLLLLAAVQPAVCEEMLFRGFIQSGLGPHGKWTAILGTAVLFGFIHGSVYRLIPATVLGLIAGYAVWQTRSILAGVLIHGLNNAILLWLARAQAISVTDGLFLPLSWGVAAVVPVGAGIYFLAGLDSEKEAAPGLQ
jgi:sodium transport system permease protein